MSEYSLLIERLKKINWFYNIGNQETVFEGVEFCWLTKPEQLEKYSTSIKWENTLDDIFYAYKNTIQLKVPNKVRMAWNDELRNYKAKVLEPIMPIIEQKIEEKKLPKCIVTEVSEMILNQFMGEYYKEYGTTPFFTTLLEIYESGHIPCGYTGKIGAGKIVIY